MGLHAGTGLRGQTISIDTSAAGRKQIMDGFGSCLAGTEAEQTWWQNLYFDDLQASLLRVDLTPVFKSPASDFTYNSPWYHNNPPLPGPETNNVRTYTNAADYSRLFAGRRAAIVVMGPNIDTNISFFDFNSNGPRVAGHAAQAGMARLTKLGDFKLFGSHWSPSPWVKVSSGNTIAGQSGNLPVNGTPWPFIWGGNFAGGKLDTSGIPRAEFDDSTLGGAGPTSALTQFARTTAAWLRGFQNNFGVKFHAISIQNELNFEEFYNSCTYPLSGPYLVALKAIRAELDKYSDLASIKLIGPEDLLGGDAYGMWQFGSGASTVHKNLQYLQFLAADPQALQALAFFCIHGYANDGVSAASATPTQWNWWANGWSSSPAAGIPANVKGFKYFGKKSWMTETSGENPAWIYPATGFPGGGAWSLALRIHQALTTGQQSAWAYWQLTDGNAVDGFKLTDHTLLQISPKYVAAKHFFRFIRPNSLQVNATVTGSTVLNASAYINDTNRTMTLVLLNTSSNALPASVATPADPRGINAWQSFTSSASALWQSNTVPIVNGTATLTVPGYGVVTLYGVAPPILRGSITPTGDLNLCWAAFAGDFHLETTPSLNTGASWSTVSNTPVTNNGVLNVVTEIAGQSRFYRLAKP